MSFFPDAITVYVIFKKSDNIIDPIGVFKGSAENLESFMARNYNDPEKYLTIKVPHFCEKGILCCGCSYYENDQLEDSLFRILLENKKERVDTGQPHNSYHAMFVKAQTPNLNEALSLFKSLLKQHPDLAVTLEHKPLV